MLKKASSRGPVALAMQRVIASLRGSTYLGYTLPGCPLRPLQWVELQRVYASSLAAAALDDLFEHPARSSVVVLDALSPDFQGPENSFSTAC